MLTFSKIEAEELDIVIGGRGFIGREFVSYLADQKRPYKSLDSSESFRDFIASGKRIDFHLVSRIVWLAGKSFPVNTPSNLDLSVTEDSINLNLLLNILIEHDWGGRLIFLSSGGCIYGESTEALHEESKINPNNSYGQLKLQHEKLISASTLKYSILRISNVFGPRAKILHGQDVISNWIRNIKSGDVCKVYGSVESFRDFIHVKDVVSAISLNSQFGESNLVLNIGSGIKTKTQELIDIFTQYALENVRFVYENSRSFDRSGYVLDVSKAKTYLGWSPQYSNKEQIKEFIARELGKKF